MVVSGIDPIKDFGWATKEEDIGIENNEAWGINEIGNVEALVGKRVAIPVGKAARKVGKGLSGGFTDIRWGELDGGKESLELFTLMFVQRAVAMNDDSPMSIGAEKQRG